MKNKNLLPIYLKGLATGKYSCARKFELCISERGIFAYMDGRYWPVRLLDEILGGLGETMPQVLQNIVFRYMYGEAKEISV